MEVKVCFHQAKEAEEVKALLMTHLIMAMLQRANCFTKVRGPKQDRNQLLAQNHHLKSAHTLVRLSHKQIRDYRKTKFNDSMRKFYQRQWALKAK